MILFARSEEKSVSVLHVVDLHTFQTSQARIPFKWVTKPGDQTLHFSDFLKKAGWTPRRRHDPPGAPLQEHAAVLLRDARARCHARAAGGPPEPPRSVRVISWPAVAAAGQAVRFRSAPRREGARAVEGSRDEPHNEARHRCGTASGRGACDGRGGRAFPQGHASPTRATAAAG